MAVRPKPKQRPRRCAPVYALRFGHAVRDSRFVFRKGFLNVVLHLPERRNAAPGSRRRPECPADPNSTTRHELGGVV
jgi:hypothetical protein